MSRKIRGGNHYEVQAFNYRSGSTVDNRYDYATGVDNANYEKVNYAKFQGVEVAQEGKKALKVDLLAKI